MARESITYQQGWKSSFIFLWLGSFITGLGYSTTMPFI